MLKGFKDFIMHGNVIDLAVGVVTGAAFGALVKAFTDAFLTPLIKLVTGGGTIGGKFTVNGVDFDYGLFLSAIITFLLTMWVIYAFVVAPYNAMRARIAKPVAEPEASNEEKLLVEIRDSLKNRPL